MILRPDQYQPGMEIQWEDELTELLDDLLETQQEMLKLLDSKRKAMTKRDLDEIQKLQPQEEELCQRLLDCQQRRSDMLEVAQKAQIPVSNLSKLSQSVLPQTQQGIPNKVKEANNRSIQLKHQSLTNWIIAQRNLLHVSQLLEIIANGGNKAPTYGGSGESAPNGFVLDQEA